MGTGENFTPNELSLGRILEVHHISVLPRALREIDPFRFTSYRASPVIIRIVSNLGRPHCLDLVVLLMSNLDIF
ncbi:hypothetical protein TNCV_1364491 [Trichonephila clavipes]|nr:hypothetical protein TNCV_1364491 [Trichonephila clavipes]